MLRGPARGVILMALLCVCAPVRAAEIPSPDAFLGARVGADRYLAPYPKVVAYLRALDAASDRVSVQVAGKSTLGNDMLVVVLTSESNQGSLDRYRAIAARLADPEGLPDEEARALIEQGKTIVLVTCSIHSTEVGSTQMAMELAYQVATTTDTDRLRWLDDVILLVMPSINPDGQVMVVDWYNKYLGTPHEGGPMPWLYHQYVGHDNNRDFYMLTQKESRVVNDVLYRDWHPQVFLDEHQMGSSSVRMFVPPQTDPVDPGIDSMVLRHADLIGTAMALRLEEAGKTGVGSNMIFDSYWPGGTRNTAWWKNVVGLLTEVASARIATPVYVEPGELRGGVKGLPEHARRANYLSPWEGGWWRLRDIIDYETIATWSLVETCSRFRRDLLTSFHRLGAKAVERGRSEPPYGFVVPADQHDPVAASAMIELLLRHGVVVDIADAPLAVGREGAVADTGAGPGTRTVYPAGSYVISASQPYRQFLLTMLRPQRYPEVSGSPGGGTIPPYDVTSWSLPVSMGVAIDPIEQPLPDAGLRRISAPAWPGGALPAAGGGGWLIPHAADSVYTAINRLLGKDRKVYWLRDRFDPSGGAGRATAPGDVYLPAGDTGVAELERLSRDLHLPVRPLERPPSGRAFRVRAPRVGLYKPWVASMDEGWTRWLLEKYEFGFVSLSNEEIRAGAFAGRIDVLVLPDVDKSIIKEGRPPEPARASFTPLPPEYAGGLDTDGGAALKKWIAEQGGVVIALDSAADYLIELLELPVTNTLEKATREQFSCPGSMLRILVDPDQPIAYGMRPVEAGYFATSPAFLTRLPDARFERRVVASYPEYDDEILVSGYLKGAELLRKRAAVVDITVGKGRVVLIGLRAQHRGQTHRTFKLLFNALYLPRLQEVSLP